MAALVGRQADNIFTLGASACMTERYINCVELALLCVFLTVAGVASFYGARRHWGRMGAAPRAMIQTLVIVAGVCACAALGYIAFNWR